MITGILLYASADLLLTLIVILLARRNRVFRARLDAAWGLLIGKAYLKVVEFGESCCPPCNQEYVEEEQEDDGCPGCHLVNDCECPLPAETQSH